MCEVKTEVILPEEKAKNLILVCLFFPGNVLITLSSHLVINFEYNWLNNPF